MIPAWVDPREYPFAPKALEVGGGTMRYVDEGDGRPVVMVHGTPTWSFLYRHLITGLRDRHRCIAPDNLGFGLSDKPVGVSYRPGDQAWRLAELIDALQLKDFTLVVHDFGGPIGLAYAIAHPERVHSVVLFNTWMWSLADDRAVAWTGRLLGSRVGRVLYERASLSVNVIWARAIRDRTRYTPAVHRHYAQALDTPVARRATWEYARELLGSSDWYESLWRQRERLRKLPALLVWGMADPAFGRFLPRWRTVFDDPQVLELPDAGHAPPEERAPELLPTLREFLAR